MKIQFLHTLTSVLQQGSFAAAAKEINLTASAVSLQMKQLEAYFGAPLFDRSARQVRPTPFATEVARTVEASLASIEALRRRDSRSVQGRVRMGTIESVQLTLLPAAMRWLRDRAPGLELEFTRGLSSWLIDEVKACRLDTALVVRPVSGGSSRLHWTPLLTETFVLIAPPGAMGRTAAELVRSHDWIGLGRAATGGRIAAQHMQRLAPTARCIFELPGIDAVVAMVSAGLGVSVVPALRDEIRQMHPVREVGLGPKAPTRQVALVCRPPDAENRRLLVLRQAFEAAVAQRRQRDTRIPCS